jgi:hypothetical protein
VRCVSRDVSGPRGGVAVPSGVAALASALPQRKSLAGRPRADGREVILRDDGSPSGFMQAPDTGPWRQEWRSDGRLAALLSFVLAVPRTTSTPTSRSTCRSRTAPSTATTRRSAALFLVLTPPASARVYTPRSCGRWGGRRHDRRGGHARHLGGQRGGHARRGPYSQPRRAWRRAGLQLRPRWYADSFHHTATSSMTMRRAHFIHDDEARSPRAWERSGPHQGARNADVRGSRMAAKADGRNEAE